MSDLIKREDVIKAIWGDDINQSEDGMVFEAQSHIDRNIRLIPSADRPQGMWELVPCTDLGEYFEGIKNGFRFRCSNCKDERRRNKLDMNFCPNCGCRMKGADDERVR